MGFWEDTPQSTANKVFNIKVLLALYKYRLITSHNFTIKHWSADTFYLTRDNCSCVRAKKAEAHIRIKSYTISNAKGSLEWKRTVTLQKNKSEKELDELNFIKISCSCYNFSVLSKTTRQRRVA